MNKELTEIVAILDKSGSMGRLVSDTVGGYNNFIKEQKIVSPKPRYYAINKNQMPYGQHD